MEQRILFQSKGKEYKFSDVVKAIKESGIKTGDVLMVHADLSAFGKLGEVTDRSAFANIFIDAFLSVIGKTGTLVVPTFTYSFCRNEIYDVNNTPSTVGLFTEELRKRKGSFRSLNPIFSVAALGRRAREVTSGLSKSSFGKGSVYDKLQKIKNSKYVIFGVNYFACTQVHYIEQKVGVAYRYSKIFRGKIKNGDKVYDSQCEYYVRDMVINPDTDFNKIEQHLIETGFLKKVSLGEGLISTVKISDIFDEGIKMIKKNIYFFLKNKPE